MKDPDTADFRAHGPLPVPNRTGHEPILDANGSALGTLTSFWQWAYSQTLENNQRGVFAEYLVGLALNAVRGQHRVEWDAYDLKTPDGITVEVKSSAYLQSWPQETPSQLKFGIAETKGWTAETNLYAESASRKAQVYVFCVLTAVDPATVDPLDTRQWDFYAVPSSQLNDEFGHQKSISLSQLLARLNPEKLTFNQLEAAVRDAGFYPRA
ncbi:hypothetical protein [Corynebacterium lubricantis]|uniref:hypothetical protein n=1 Tax=Corynebacterium lubricantis TaxID=541095 RepID=UPI0003769EB6|nr:hypothetical protein [Corynebacterium lubricantis]